MGADEMTFASGEWSERIEKRKKDEVAWEFRLQI